MVALFQGSKSDNILVWLDRAGYNHSEVENFLNGTAIRRFRMVWAVVPFWIMTGNEAPPGREVAFSNEW